MILAVDAGNSRIKWGYYENGVWSITDAIEHTAIDSLAVTWQRVPAPEQIVISNVAGAEVQRKLSVALSHFAVAPHWLKPEQQRCGVTNGYAVPSQLGSDRWAALIGARREESGPALVVNVGTALTIDAMTANGQFLGGLIAPGIRLMMQALTTGTAHAHAEHGEFAPFPTNTMDAIYSGALNAALGSIKRMSDALATHADVLPVCIVSGGAASALISHLPPPTREIPNLVLLGLVTIAEASH